MKDLRISLTRWLIFPVAPVAVIYLTFNLCREIWQASFYSPGEDGGEVEPTLALFIAPLLLLIAAFALAGLTALTRWVARRFEPGAWWRWSMAVPRIILTLVSLGLFLAATAFLTGDMFGALRHWQVAFVWATCAATTAAFLAQQVSRLRA